jgi:hypothetical protein
MLSSAPLTGVALQNKRSLASASVILLLRFTFLYNLFPQFFDGLLTYQVSLGVPEANPLVNAAISEWVEFGAYVTGRDAGVCFIY